MTSWTIGSAPDCDLVVDRPSVSGRHCRLTQQAGVYFLEDLKSTNGTYVEGERIFTKTRVRRTDAITLGRSIAMPWPDADPIPATRVVSIGRSADNDVVVDRPSVSGRHARIICDDRSGEVVLEDLDSANGTAIGSPERKIARAPLAATDTVYLGTFAIPATELLRQWPESDSKEYPLLVFRGAELLIGRDLGCDSVIDLPMVSGRHARLHRAGTSMVIEDLSSSNGTFVNGVRIQRAAAVRPGDRIGFGSYTVLLVDASTPAAMAAGGAFRSDPGPIDDLMPLIPVSPAESVGSAAVDGLAAIIKDLPGHLLLLGATVGSALLLVLAFGQDARLAPDATNRAIADRAAAATLFGLGLAAIAFGVLDALRPPSTNRALPRGEVPSRTAWARGLGRGFGLLLRDILGCVLLLTIVHAGNRLRGAWLPTLGVLGLGAAVGLAMGQAYVAFGDRPRWTRVLLPVLMALLILPGSPGLPLPRLAPALRPVANFSPARWIFEDLLLLESRGRLATASAPVATAPDREAAAKPGVGPAPPPDLLEPYFPATRDRMGLVAGLIALETTLAECLLLAVAAPYFRRPSSGMTPRSREA